MSSKTSGLRVRPVTRRDLIKLLGIGAAGASLGGMGLIAPKRAYADGAVQVPISDFIDAQGSDDFYVPPERDQFAWCGPTLSGVPALCALVDYCGFHDDLLGGVLGTTTDGSVTERSLADGRTQVNVVLHTKRALTRALIISDPWNAGDEWAVNPLQFGYRFWELQQDPSRTPALAESHFDVTYTTAPGVDPMEDLVWKWDGVNLVVNSLKFRATAFGPMRAEFGVPEGTPGSCVISQTGNYGTGISYKHRGFPSDAFPVEFVKLNVLGG